MGNFSLTYRVLIAVVTACVSVRVSPEESPERKTRFRAETVEEAVRWQEASRKKLFELLKLDDLVEANKPDAQGAPGLPLAPKLLSAEDEEKFTRHEVEINSTRSRRIRAVVTIPRPLEGKSPAVVCIHGHGGNRHVVYRHDSPYRGFAQVLAERGYVTISTDVGQHKVYEEGRTLMGERLWDVIRCVDYLTTREDVDSRRIACAGLSLGGEMTMWLGAMDTRVKATVSSGFLTTVDNMLQGHCPCWNFPGFTENFDFADIYSLIAPRHLQCQNGELERAPGGFPVFIAEKAMIEIKGCYAVFGQVDRVELLVHPAGHIFDVAAGVKFLEAVLKSGVSGR
jgi:hypothetical protein